MASAQTRLWATWWCAAFAAIGAGLIVAFCVGGQGSNTSVGSDATEKRVVLEESATVGNDPAVRSTGPIPTGPIASDSDPAVHAPVSPAQLRLLAKDERRTQVDARVTLGDPGQPLEGVTVAAVFAHTEPPAPRSENELRLESRTDKEGVARFQVPLDEDVVLSVSCASGTASARVQTNRLAAGSTVQLHIQSDTIAVGGRVEDARSGSPISGATLIWTAMDVSESNTEATELLRLGSTNSDGRFQARVPSETGRVVVAGKGYADHHSTAADIRRLGSADLVIRLTPTGGIRVRVVDASSKPLSGVWVRLGARSAVQSMHPSALGAQVLVYDGQTNDVGECAWSDVPAGVRLLVEITDSSSLVGRAPSRVTAVAGGESVVVLTLATERSLRVSVVDQRSIPVAHRRIWIRPFDEFVGLNPQAEDETWAQYTTDEAGRFVARSLPAGDWIVAPAPNAAEEPDDDVSSFGQRFTIAPRDLDVEVVLTAYRGLFFVGTVRDRSGNPVDGATVRVRGTSDREVASAHCGADGGFRIGPVGPLVHALQAFGETELGEGVSDVLEAQASESDLRLTIRHGVMLRGRLTGVSPETSGTAWIRAISTVKHGGPSQIDGFVEANGDFVLPANGAGPYVLVGGIGLARIGVARDVWPQFEHEPSSTVVLTEPASLLSVSAARSGGAKYELWRNDAMIEVGEVSSDPIEIPTMPGECRLECRWPDGRTRTIRVERLRPGSTHVIHVDE